MTAWTDDRPFRKISPKMGENGSHRQALYMLAGHCQRTRAYILYVISNSRSHILPAHYFHFFFSFIFTIGNCCPWMCVHWVRVSKVYVLSFARIDGPPLYEMTGLFHYILKFFPFSLFFFFFLFFHQHQNAHTKTHTDNAYVCMAAYRHRIHRAAYILTSRIEMSPEKWYFITDFSMRAHKQ